MSDLTENQLQLLGEAARYLERPSLLMSIANLVGKPLEYFTRGIDKLTAGRVDEAVNGALRAALSVAVFTVPNKKEDILAPAEELSDVGSGVAFWHKVSVALTGTAGGLFGLPGLIIELPLTTTIMLRSIASVAKEFGEDLSDPAIRLQCLSVFCFGGPSGSDDAMESTYLTVRMGVQAELRAAAHATAGLTAEQLTTAIHKGTAPAIVSLLSRIAARFDVAVTEKIVAQAIPLVGAAAGATVNVAFMGHFNRVARYHFAIRSLERQHGVDLVQAAYRQALGQARQVR